MKVITIGNGDLPVNMIIMLYAAILDANHAIIERAKSPCWIREVFLFLFLCCSLKKVQLVQAHLRLSRLRTIHFAFH